MFVHLSEELDLHVRCTRGTFSAWAEGKGGESYTPVTLRLLTRTTDSGYGFFTLFPTGLVTSADCRLRADCDDTGDRSRDFADTNSTSAVAGIPTRPNMTPPRLNNYNLWMNNSSNRRIQITPKGLRH